MDEGGQDTLLEKLHKALDACDVRLYAARLDTKSAELALFNPDALAKDIPEEIVTLTGKDYKGTDPTRCNVRTGLRFCARLAGHEGFHLDGWGMGWEVTT